MKCLLEWRQQAGAPQSEQYAHGGDQVQVHSGGHVCRRGAQDASTAGVGQEPVHIRHRQVDGHQQVYKAKVRRGPVLG